MSIIRETPRLSPTLEKLIDHAHRRSYDAKRIIIHEGDITDSLYYIIEGSVNVQAENEAGDEIILAYLNEGDFFGEAVLFDSSHTNKSKRTAWVIARTQCIFAKISYEQFRNIVSEDPAVMFLMTSQIFGLPRKTGEKVRDLIFLDAKGHIAHYLLELTKEPDAITNPDGMQIKICTPGYCQDGWMLARDGRACIERAGRRGPDQRSWQNHRRLRYALITTFTAEEQIILGSCYLILATKSISLCRNISMVY